MAIKSLDKPETIPLMLSSGQVCELLDISLTTLERLRRQKNNPFPLAKILPTRARGRGGLRWTRDAVVKWSQSLETADALESSNG
jgi:hypothetical protein